MFPFRRIDDRAQHSAFIRVTKNGQEIFLGEVRPGHTVHLPDGIQLEYLWTRTHHPPKRDAAKS